MHLSDHSDLSTIVRRRCARCTSAAFSCARGWTSARPAEARVSILLYDALDFSTDRDDGGGQTRESLSRIASPSAAVARLDPARFARQVRRSRQVLWLVMWSNTASERKITSAAEIFFW